MSKKGIWKQIEEERVQKIILAAKELFLKFGIDGVRMSDIALKSEIGVASIYRYNAVNTKDKIVIAVCISIWKDVLNDYQKYIGTSYFDGLDGFNQIKVIFSFYLELYTKYNNTVKFIYYFDVFCIANKIDILKLSNYEKELYKFYRYYENACIKGIEDGSIKPDINYKDIYFSVNHSVMAFMKRLSVGSLLYKDAGIDIKEIGVLIDIFVNYFKKIQSED